MTPSRVLLAVTVWMIFAIPTQAAGIYSMQKVAGNSDGYFSISGFSGINDVGNIVFDARVGPNANQNGVFVWNGSGITTIAKTTQAGGNYEGITPAHSINSSGFVAFRAILPDLSSGIFVGNGGAPTTIATADCLGCDFDSVSRAPTINDAGVVAFQALDSTVDHIYTQSMFGGPRTLIVDTGITTPFRTFGQIATVGTVINSTGAVAFHAGLKSGINDDGLYLGIGNNVFTTIAEDGDLAPGGETFVSFSAPSLNDVGDVAFCGSLTNTEAGMYLWHAGSLTTIADTMGTFNGFTFPDTGLGCSQTGMPSLNDAGQVAFFGRTNQGGDAIYIWDGTLHRIIGEGDSVAGDEITSIRYFAGGLNNSGDFPFAADLAHADPIFFSKNETVPEPGTVLLLGSALAALAWRRRGLRFAALAACVAGAIHAGSLQYELTPGPVTGPPYPTAPITMNATTDSGIPIGMMSLKLDSVAPSTSLLLTPGAAVGGINPQPFLPVSFSLQNPGDPLAAVVVINPCMDVDPFGGSNPVLLLPAVMPDSGGSFDVFFDIEVQGGVAHQQLHFAIGAGQPLTFANPTAIIGHSIDMSFELHRTVGAALAPGPLFTMTASGDFSAPEPATVLLLGSALAALAWRRRALRFAALAVCAAGAIHAGSLQYELTSGPVTGPPYPTAPITMNATADSGIPIGMMSLKLDSVAPSTSLLLTPGAAVGGVTPTPFFPVSFSLQNPGDPLAAVVVIAPCLDVDPFGGSNPVLLLPAVMPDSGGFFDVFFDIEVQGGVAHQQLHYEIGAGQPLTFANPTAIIGHSIDMSFELHRTVGAALGPGPLFTMTASGDFSAPEPATASLLGSALALLWGGHRFRSQF